MDERWKERVDGGRMANHTRHRFTGRTRVAAVVSLLLASVFLRVFPACFVEGQGLTPFKKVSEYIISLVLLGSAGFLYRRRTEIGQRVFRLMGTSILPTPSAIRSSGRSGKPSRAVPLQMTELAERLPKAGKR